MTVRAPLRPHQIPPERDLKVAVGLLQAQRRRAGLSGREFEWATENVADPRSPHELKAGQSSQVLPRFLRVPFPQLGVLRLLTDDRVFYDCVAEVIHHRRDGKDATQPLIQTLVRCGLGLCVRGIRPRQNYWGSA